MLITVLFKSVHVNKIYANSRIIRTIKTVMTSKEIAMYVKSSGRLSSTVRVRFRYFFHKSSYPPEHVVLYIGVLKIRSV